MTINSKIAFLLSAPAGKIASTATADFQETAVAGQAWFKSLTEKQQKQYLKLHPNSKLRPGGAKVPTKKSANRVDPAMKPRALITPKAPRGSHSVQMDWIGDVYPGLKSFASKHGVHVSEVPITRDGQSDIRFHYDPNNKAQVKALHRHLYKNFDNMGNISDFNQDGVQRNLPGFKALLKHAGVKNPDYDAQKRRNPRLRGG